MEIVWKGIRPLQNWIDQCNQAIADMDLEKPEDLIFHDEWLLGEPDKRGHVSAVIWGEVGCDHLWGQLNRDLKYVTIQEAHNSWQ